MRHHQKWHPRRKPARAPYGVDSGERHDPERRAEQVARQKRRDREGQPGLVCQPDASGDIPQDDAHKAVHRGKSPPLLRVEIERDGRVGHRVPQRDEGDADRDDLERVCSGPEDRFAGRDANGDGRDLEEDLVFG